MLRPNPAFVPKIITTSYRSRVLELDAFYPPPHRDGAEERWHCLCPVRAVACYVEHTRTLRTSDQMFVCFGTAARGRALSKQRLAHWLCECIAVAYESTGLPAPVGVRAHSTRDFSEEVTFTLKGQTSFRLLTCVSAL
ncbi:hypothetical protein DPEC_G00295310 [Dallia pectoralis]|uniref:Uncharacterized protein n=1 Tax=Dallia pectoralis TaxID=75939 RepID=A0ACC2FIN1_DALPE|nr:hypothetical protein DPEC_G00295310 [Dallia pectoralis]